MRTRTTPGEVALKFWPPPSALLSQGLIASDVSGLFLLFSAVTQLQTQGSTPLWNASYPFQNQDLHMIDMRVEGLFHGCSFSC